MLHAEELKIFGKDMGGGLEQRVDRLLAASASVDRTVYKLAFLLKAGLLPTNEPADEYRR